MKTEKQLTQLSKFLSYVLRHKPESIGLTLNTEGWAVVSDLLRLAKDAGTAITLDELKQIVASDSKGRYSFSADQSFIRANQGHSTDTVDIKHQKAVPPVVLYHGTADKNLESIMKQGLVPGSRHHVHLSADMETAIKVGQRHGKVVVLKIDAKEMLKRGYDFYVSENGVWLVSAVPSEFIGAPK